MKVIYANLVTEKFVAINLFGILFVRKEYKDHPDNSRWWKSVINHELIHTEQIKECWYIGFYILYLIAWIFRIITAPWETAYKDISFEQEAWRNEDNFDYLLTRQPYNWIGHIFENYKTPR